MHDRTHDRWVEVKELDRTGDLRAMKEEFNRHRLLGQAPPQPAHQQPVAPQVPIQVPAPPPVQHRYMLRSRQNN